MIFTAEIIRLIFLPVVAFVDDVFLYQHVEPRIDQILLVTIATIIN